ncbi:MAG TPA: APC family permease, partial [Ktedonobacteraceae bacterium]|nr:APC family permease [Ktedonobacteraceae bacterium]
LIANASGGAAPLATLIGAIGVLALGWIIIQYARRYHGAGAIYDYLRRFSPALGLFSAIVYFLGTIFEGGAGLYLILGLFGSSTLQADLGWNVPWWAVALVAGVLVFLLNHFGVRITTRAQITLTCISVLPLLLLAFVIILQGGDAGNTVQAFNPSATSLSGLFGGLLFAVTLFTGFEASASLGEETANPRRSIPLAVAGTILLSAIFYLLVIYSSDIGFGLNHSQAWATDPAPLSTLATRYVGKWLSILIDFALLFDMLAVASAFTATSARGWFALARHRLLPAFFARTSRFQTPLGGNILVFCCMVLVTGITALLGLDPGVAFGVTAGIGAILIEIIYIVLALGAVRFLIETRQWWGWIILVVAVLTPLLAIYGTVVPFPAWPLSLEVYIGIGGLILAGAWTLLVTLIFPQRLKAVSEPHAWE